MSKHARIEQKSPSMSLVAVDDGYAQTKLWTPEGPDGQPLRFVTRSTARPGRYGLGSLGGGSAVGAYEATPEGDEFTVSEDVEGESTQFDGYHTSTMNRVLVHHALAEAGFGGREIRLVTGLPVADYFVGTDRDSTKIDTKRSNLMKGVADRSGSRTMPRILEVAVGCQAVAAFVDHVVGDDLSERHDPSAPTAVVDIGGRTTDLAVVVRGTAIDHARSGTDNTGVLDVYASLSKSIRDKWKVRDRFPVANLDRAVRTGAFRLWGREEDVSEMVQQAVREHEGKIRRFVERLIGSGSTLSSVVFVGGGASVFENVAKGFPNGVLADDAEFANARGLYKYVRYFEQP